MNYIDQVQVDEEQEQDWGRQRKQQEQRPQGYCLENVNFYQFYIVSFAISEVAGKLGGDIALLSIALASSPLPGTLFSFFFWYLDACYHFFKKSNDHSF